MEPAQGGVFGRQDEVLAAIRDELGPEAAEAYGLAERARDPQPLTDDESTEFRATLAAVLADLRATGAILPDIREEAHGDQGPDVVSAWLQSPPGRGSAGGMGIRVLLSEPPAERLADLADQIQEWEVEELSAAGRPATWPECQRHPGTHPPPAQSTGRPGRVVLPKTGQVISPIGALGNCPMTRRHQHCGQRRSELSSQAEMWPGAAGT